jgi:hypothetical protein
MIPVFSTAYLPPIAYVAALMQHDDVLIETKETFPKQTYRNRAEIMTAGGVRTLTVPVIRDNHSRTEEVGIDYKERWNIVHLRTLTAAYSASPYFLYYKDPLEKLLTTRYERLVELNQALLTWILQLLKAGNTITLTTDFQKSYEMDFRNTFSPKHPYPTEGMKEYYQVFSDRIPFTPNLSIIDLLMNLGPEAKDYLKSIL